MRPGLPLVLSTALQRDSLLPVVATTVENTLPSGDDPA